MAGRAIEAGKTFVTMSLDADGVKKSLRSVEQDLKRFAKSAAAIGAAFTASSAIVVESLRRASLAASEAAVTARALTEVFDGNISGPRQFARELARAIGDSRFEVEKAIVSFQSFFQGIGFGREQAFEFNKRMVTLSRDLAAFRGLTYDDALQRFISALSGSPEVLDRYGINLKAAAINQELLRQGIQETTATATEQQKVLARISVIEQALGAQGAIGRAVKELDTFAGQLRASKAAIKDLAVSVGTPLLAPLRLVLRAFNGLVRAVTFLTDSVPGLTVLLGVLAVAVGALGVALLGLAAIAGTAAVAITALGKAIVFLEAVSIAATVKLIASATAVGLLTTVLLGAKVAVIGLGAALAFLVSPLALIAAGLAGAAYFAGVFDRAQKGLNRTLSSGRVQRFKDSSLPQARTVIRRTREDGVTEGFRQDVASRVRGGAQKIAQAESKQEASFREKLEERIEDLQIAGIENRERREFAAIRAKYDREREEFEGNARIRIQLDKAQAQAEANVRARFDRERERAAASIQARIDRLRTDGIENRSEREIELIRIQYAREVEIAKDSQEKIRLLRKAEAIAIENVRREAGEREKDFQASILRELESLRISAIQSQTDRELAEIEQRYQEEVQAAKDAAASLENVEKLKQARIDAVRRQAEERRSQREFDELQQGFDATEALAREVERLEINLGTPDGLEKQLALIEQARVNAIADAAGEAGTTQEQLDLIDRRAELQKAIATQQDAAQELGQRLGRTFGTFSGQQIKAGLGAGTSKEVELLQRQLDEQEKTNRRLEEIKRGQGASA